MTIDRSTENLVRLVHELCKLPGEAEALKAVAIVPDDPAAAPKLTRYVPVWARAEDHTVT